MRRGDPQARMIADPAVRTDPISFIEEMRAGGRIVKTRAGYLTTDYEIAHELLRSEDFRVTGLGANLPKPLRWLHAKSHSGLLHPLEPPSLLSVEPPKHTRYRKLVSSVFTSRAVAALRDRVEETAKVLLDDLADQPGTVDIVERYCSQLPVTVIGDILGVPDEDRQQILTFGDLGAPSLDAGLPWRQYRQVHQGILGFNTWLADHLRSLRRNPGDNLLSQLIEAADEGGRLNDRELQATAGLVLA